MNRASDIIASNWHELLAEVAEAAERAGRSPEEIKIVGVSKYVDASMTRCLFAAGCHLLGESRPQSLWDKATALADLDCQWHMIGHLQRNKVKRTLPLCHLVHGVDSVRLAEAISTAAESPANILLEVNVSGDANKQGFLPAAMLQAIEEIAAFTHIRVQGLMAMAGLEHQAEAARQDFCRLRDLRDELVTRGLPQNVSLSELSMGMSGDFPQAIAEGATIIRVGSRLFAGAIDG